MQERQIKYDYINALRGVAVVLVIIIHVTQITSGLPNWFAFLGTKGQYGVQLFFILSAFTIFLSYSRRAEKEGKAAIRNFFIRRFFRITPMYYLAALFYTIYYYNNPELFKQQFQLIKVLPSILYMNGFFLGAVNYIPPGGWSVGVEMAFYLTVPFLFKKVTNLNKAIWLFIILFTLSTAIKFLMRYVASNVLHINYHALEDWSLYFWFPNQMSIFALGILLKFAVTTYGPTKKSVAYIWVTVLTGVIIALFFIKAQYDKKYYLIPEHITTAILLAGIVFLMSKVKIAQLDNRVTRFLGEISFSLYLVHFAIVNLASLLIPQMPNPYISFILTLLFVICIGAIVSRITYLLVEKTGIGLGEKLIKSLDGRVAAIREKKEEVW